MTLLALPDNLYRLIKARPEVLSEIAECIVLFGQSRANTVSLNAWGITPLELQELYTLPVFVTELEGIKKEVGNDPHAIRRLRARRLFDDNLETFALDVLNDAEASAGERTNVMKLLKEIAGIDTTPDEGKGSKGVVVNINIGGVQQQAIIEGEVVGKHHD